MKEGLSKETAEMSADLIAICNAFGLEPVDLGISRCWCGCGKILGPTMKTIRVLTAITMVLIKEHIECPPVDGDSDGKSVQELDYAALEQFKPAAPGSMS